VTPDGFFLHARLCYWRPGDLFFLFSLKTEDPLRSCKRVENGFFSSPLPFFRVFFFGKKTLLSPPRQRCRKHQAAFFPSQVSQLVSAGVRTSAVPSSPPRDESSECSSPLFFSFPYLGSPTAFVVEKQQDILPQSRRRVGMRHPHHPSFPLHCGTGDDVGIKTRLRKRQKRERGPLLCPLFPPQLNHSVKRERDGDGSGPKITAFSPPPTVSESGGKPSVFPSFPGGGDS